ncbi:hypothetical protein G4B88_002518 [Cannabis sativa]|uniref:Uncharacterized protein n=2 Tax=Cannabis sativa TaxID=3483 RepID=A0A7J6I914_CANSA|nr:hypothetical protein G4B88_002518 [Cannabis sativa]
MCNFDLFICWPITNNLVVKRGHFQTNIHIQVIAIRMPDLRTPATFHRFPQFHSIIKIIITLFFFRIHQGLVWLPKEHHFRFFDGR